MYKEKFQSLRFFTFLIVSIISFNAYVSAAAFDGYRLIDELPDELPEISSGTNNKYAEISRLRDSKLSAEVLENGYVPTLIKLIKSNIKYKVEAGLAGNPTATFHVRLFPNGEVLSATKLVGSGIPEYDTAIEKAIYYSSPFPKRSDGKVERELEFIFRLKN